MQRVTREEAEEKILNLRGIQHASMRSKSDLVSINNTIFDYVELLEENIIEAQKMLEKVGIKETK